MADQQAQSGGIGVAGLLGVAFVVLKLCHVIDWRWRWVLAPFWVPFAVIADVLAICGAAVLVACVWDALPKAARRG